MRTFIGFSSLAINPFIHNSLTPDPPKNSPILHDQETWSKVPGKDIQKIDKFLQLTKNPHTTLSERSLAVWCHSRLACVRQSLEGFEPIQTSGVIRIRIICRNNWTHVQQFTENAGIIAHDSGEPMACYTDGKSKICILSGSI